MRQGNSRLPEQSHTTQGPQTQGVSSACPGKDRLQPADGSQLVAQRSALPDCVSAWKQGRHLFFISGLGELRMSYTCGVSSCAVRHMVKSALYARMRYGLQISGIQGLCAHYKEPLHQQHAISAAEHTQQCKRQHMSCTARLNQYGGICGTPPPSRRLAQIGPWMA